MRIDLKPQKLTPMRNKQYGFVGFLLLLFILETTILAAQPYHTSPGMTNTTSLTVSFDRQPFWLFLDDVLQNEQPVMSIKVNHIPEGMHYLRVEINNEEHTTVGKLMQIGPMPQNLRIETIHNLYGLTTGYVVPRPELVMTMVSVQPNNPHGNRPGQSSWFGYHQHGQPSMAPPPAPGPMAMNEADFNMALEMVKKENFDSNRLSLAKQITRQNMLSVSQIKRLCQTFEFDNTKLDFAKYAYSRCVDPERYFLLYDVFTFDSNKRSLDTFLQQQH